MTEIGKITVNRGPLNKHECMHITDAIADIRRPYEKLILDYCATRIPKTVIHENGTIENEWDLTTQSFIDRTQRQMIEAVRQYLRSEGL